MWFVISWIHYMHLDTLLAFSSLWLSTFSRMTDSQSDWLFSIQYVPQFSIIPSKYYWSSMFMLYLGRMLISIDQETISATCCTMQFMYYVYIYMVIGQCHYKRGNYNYSWKSLVYYRLLPCYLCLYMASLWSSSKLVFFPPWMTIYDINA